MRLQGKGVKGLQLGAALAGLALAIAWLPMGFIRSASAQTPLPVSSTLLATNEVSAIPAGHRWVIRGEHPQNVQHTHAGGFVFASGGSSTLVMEDARITLKEGDTVQAIWVPEGVPHMHLNDAGAHLWSFTFESESEPQTTAFLFAGKTLTSFEAGPHLLRLLTDRYQPSASTQFHRHYGPETVFIREGRYELNNDGTPFSYAAGSGYVVDAQARHRLSNPTNDQAALFNLSMVPLGRPTAENLPQ
jgi:quercetin dioxygenase-like cupin family protein